MRKCLSCGPQICSRRPQHTDAGLRNIAPRRLDLEPPTSIDLQSEGSSSACSCAYVKQDSRGAGPAWRLHFRTSEARCSETTNDEVSLHTRSSSFESDN